MLARAAGKRIKVFRFFHLTTVSSLRKIYTISYEPERIKRGKRIKL
jgi:hypothetical protein